jgi:hypothetical protein
MVFNEYLMCHHISGNGSLETTVTGRQSFAGQHIRRKPPRVTQRYFCASVRRHLYGMEVSYLTSRHWPQLESKHMRKILVVIAMALALAGCANGRQDRVASGALIGGGTGALIGGLAGHSAGAALAGGLIGAAAGAIIADATRPGWCYYWRHHRRHYVRC